LFVIRESYSEAPFAELIPQKMLEQSMVVSALLVVTGVALKMFEKGSRAVSTSRNRCKECGKQVSAGAIYCREHLRNMLEREDQRTHATRPGR
jgi:hypothetical protein